MYENTRHIKNVISETKIRNLSSIQPEAWKLLVEIFARSAMQEYGDKRKAKEQGEQEKLENNPNPHKNDRPNHPQSPEHDTHLIIQAEQTQLKPKKMPTVNLVTRMMRGESMNASLQKFCHK